MNLVKGPVKSRARTMIGNGWEESSAASAVARWNSLSTASDFPLPCSPTTVKAPVAGVSRTLPRYLSFAISSATDSSTPSDRSGSLQRETERRMSCRSFCLRAGMNGFLTACTSASAKDTLMLSDRLSIRSTFFHLTCFPTRSSKSSVLESRCSAGSLNTSSLRSEEIASFISSTTG